MANAARAQCRFLCENSIFILYTLQSFVKRRYRPFSLSPVPKLIDKRTDTPCLTKRRNSKSRFALGRPAYDGSEKPKTFNFPAKFCRNLRIAGQKSASCTACAPLSSFLEAVRVSIPRCCQINLYCIRNLLSFNVIARKSLIFRHILIALILYRCTYGRLTASQRLHPASCHFCASIAP